MVDVLLKYRLGLIIGVQATLVVFANYLAFWLRFDGAIPDPYVALLIQTLPWLVAIQGLVFILFQLHRGLWRYAGIWELRNIIAAVACGTVLFYGLVRWGLGLTLYPRSVCIMGAVLLICLLGGMRLSRRIGPTMLPLKREKRVLIYGAGNAGEMIVREMQKALYEYEPVGFVDDDPSVVGQRIHGVPVLGTGQDLTRIIATKQPHEVLVALPAADPATIRRVVKTLEQFTIPITTLPNLRELLQSKVSVSQIRHLALEDLLPRVPVELDPEPVRHLVTGKRLLVTGAAGSIGSELCRQIAAWHPSCLVLYDHNENGLHAIGLDLKSRYPSLCLHQTLGDVTDEQRINSVMMEYQPQIIFHAAAHKHVPMMEWNPCEAVKNNVLGTRMVAEASARCGAERFVLISSDKAVNPVNVMGVTKRVAELLVLARQCQTHFMVVRFGNVLGSNGSVVPHFLEQIKAGGPVTVTHPEMQRYFMLIPEAVHLVLHAAAMSDGGEMYVLEMGKQIKVVELARNLIRLMGYVPEEDIPINFVGLRPGEKLYEELVGGDEKVAPSGVDNIQRVSPLWLPDVELITQHIATLEQYALRNDAQRVLKQLRKAVPTFRPESPGLEECKNVAGLPRSVTTAR